MRTGPLISTISLLLLAATLGCSDDPTSVSPQRYSQLSDSSFVVADSSIIEIINFAGSVDVMSGESHVINVVVEKWASQVADLDEIEVEMLQLPSGVSVHTTNPTGLLNVSVDLAVTAPMDVGPAIRCGAGEINHSGPAPRDSFFGTGAGTITFRLPADVNVEIHLYVGAGVIRVDYPVVGQIDEHNVDGVIGTGADGRIVASAGAGAITVTPQ